MLRTAPKSRRDDTLLTVDFNLRENSNMRILQSPAGTTLFSEERRVKNEECATLLYKCRPLRDFVQSAIFAVRRLKPTVNKVSSLRDYVADNLMCHFMIVALLRSAFVDVGAPNTHKKT